MIRLELPGSSLRPLREEDAASLARHADDPEVAANLRDRFPHPYSTADAERWIGSNRTKDPAEVLGIAVGEEIAGCIGLELQQDVHRHSAEVGYWLGREHWGKGLATAALRGFLPYAFERFDLIRVYATVFSSNPASRRVLEKAGMAYEGRMRASVVKNGRVLDQLLYAMVREGER